MSDDRIEPSIGEPSSVPPPTAAIEAETSLRPLPLTIIAWLAMLAGLGLLGLHMINLQTLVDAYNESGISALLALPQIVILIGVYIWAGLAILEGGKTGWLLSMLALIQGLLASLVVLLSAHLLGLPVSLMSAGTLSPYTLYGCRALLQILLIAYFFSPAVLRYLDMTVGVGLLCLFGFSVALIGWMLLSWWFPVIALSV